MMPGSAFSLQSRELTMAYWIGILPAEKSITLHVGRRCLVTPRRISLLASKNGLSEFILVTVVTYWQCCKAILMVMLLSIALNTVYGTKTALIAGFSPVELHYAMPMVKPIAWSAGMLISLRVSRPQRNALKSMWRTVPGSYHCCSRFPTP